MNAKSTERGKSGQREDDRRQGRRENLGKGSLKIRCSMWSHQPIGGMHMLILISDWLPTTSHARKDGITTTPLNPGGVWSL